MKVYILKSSERYNPNARQTWERIKMSLSKAVEKYYGKRTIVYTWNENTDFPQIAVIHKTTPK